MKLYDIKTVKKGMINGQKLAEAIDKRLQEATKELKKMEKNGDWTKLEHYSGYQEGYMDVLRMLDQVGFYEDLDLS